MKTYVGNGKEKQFDDGSVINISFSEKDLDTMRANLNKGGWINLTCAKRKEVGKYGETHSIYVNDWKPTVQKDTVQKDSTVQNNSGVSFDDMDENFPF